MQTTEIKKESVIASVWNRCRAAAKSCRNFASRELRVWRKATKRFAQSVASEVVAIKETEFVKTVYRAANTTYWFCMPIIGIITFLSAILIGSSAAVMTVTAAGTPTTGAIILGALAWAVATGVIGTAALLIGAFCAVFLLEATLELLTWVVGLISVTARALYNNCESLYERVQLARSRSSSEQPSVEPSAILISGV